MSAFYKGAKRPTESKLYPVYRLVEGISCHQSWNTIPMLLIMQDNRASLEVFSCNYFPNSSFIKIKNYYLLFT